MKIALVHWYREFNIVQKVVTVLWLGVVWAVFSPYLFWGDHV